MRVWLDMANSPHPMLLGPVARRLEESGHDVWVTTRNHAQTVDLTRQFWPDARVVGGASPSSRPGKVKALAERIVALRRLAGHEHPNVAVSLNSYAQIVAARAARIPSLTLMDYEYQPANHVSFRLATRVVVPDVFPQDRLRLYGARSEHRVIRLNGFKEEFYLDSTPMAVDDGWSALPRSTETVRCLFRPAPHGAMYHREDNQRFDNLLRTAGENPHISALVLPRFAEQRAAYALIPGVHVAEQTVDGLQALRNADAFVGAGGTMCREAALLGIPSYTMFAGRLAAVDAALISVGRLHDLRSAPTNPEEWERRPHGESRADAERARVRAEELRSWLVARIEDVAGLGQRTSAGASIATSAAA